MTETKSQYYYTLLFQCLAWALFQQIFIVLYALVTTYHYVENL